MPAYLLVDKRGVARREFLMASAGGLLAIADMAECGATLGDRDGTPTSIWLTEGASSLTQHGSRTHRRAGAVLLEHGIVDFGQMSEAQIDDFIAWLETLTDEDLGNLLGGDGGRHGR